jgi:Fic family protein
MLYPTPVLSSADLNVLAGIDELRIGLRDRLRSRPGKWTSGLRRFLVADAIAASNSSVGVAVATVDVQDLIDGETDVDASRENQDETRAYQLMMSYLQSLSGAVDFSYSKGQLNAMHWMLQGHRHTPAAPAGQWRPGPVYVSDAQDPAIAVYTGPQAARVPELMAELVAWLNAEDRSHPLVRAAMAHLHLVSIHPWADGNGRMSRSLQTLVLAREGVLAPEFSSIEAWLGRPGNTRDYYRELAGRGASYDPAQDVSRWVRFNLIAYHQQAQSVQARFTRSERAGEELLRFVQSGRLPERTVTALHDIAVSGRVRRTRYERAEGLTLQQAQRDLRDLVIAQVLEPVGQTRSRYYRAGPRFPESALAAMQAPVTLADPYAG